MDTIDVTTKLLAALVALVALGKSAIAGWAQMCALLGRKSRAEAEKRRRRAWSEGEYLRSQFVG